MSRTGHFAANFYQTSKKELTPILVKLFHDLKKGGYTVNTVKLILWTKSYPDTKTG